MAVIPGTPHIPNIHNWHGFPYGNRTIEEFRCKTSYAPKQKNPVFVGFARQCISPIPMPKYFSTKQVIKLSSAAS